MLFWGMATLKTPFLADACTETVMFWHFHADADPKALRSACQTG